MRVCAVLGAFVDVRFKGAIARERAAARNPASASAAAAAASSSGKAPSAPSTFSGPRRSKDQSGKELLLDEDEEWFLPAAEAALEEVFRRFDSAHPMPASAAVHRDSLSWTVADLQRFAMATNGRLFTTEELVEVQDNLEHNEQGQLTLQGFLDLFHLQTTAHVRTHALRRTGRGQDACAVTQWLSLNRCAPAPVSALSLAHSLSLCFDAT